MSEDRPVAWVSRSKWSSQPRPLRGMDLQLVPPPFRGATLEERHPADPPIPLTEEERRVLCPTCLVPEIHRGVHRRGSLHRIRTDAARTPRLGEGDVAAALAILERLRPELLRRPQPVERLVGELEEGLEDVMIEEF